MKKTLILAAVASTLALSACVSQEQADAKMGEGCKAAIAAMLAPRTIKEVKSITSADEKTEGSLYRRVTVTYTENDDFAEKPREGSCLFAQQWGSLKSTHTAFLEQLVVNGKLIGKRNGLIEGDMNDFMKLSEGADTAMGQ